MAASCGRPLLVVFLRRPWSIFFLQAEEGIRDSSVTGVQTCALPICRLSDNCGKAIELATMLDGLAAVIAQATAGPAIVASSPEAEDIHHFVELQLTKAIGNLALKLHTGRSRNEQIATDMRLFVRDAIDRTLAGLHDSRVGLVELATPAGDPVAPSYT